MENWRDWALAIGAPLFLLFYFIAWRWWELRRSTKAGPCQHRYRVIVAPYVRQCRLCGAVEYGHDPKGDFPDGLDEYIEGIQQHRYPNPRQKSHEELWPEANKRLCHCGMQMEEAHNQFGHVWKCPTCESWRLIEQ